MIIITINTNNNLHIQMFTEDMHLDKANYCKEKCRFDDIKDNSNITFARAYIDHNRCLCIFSIGLK